MNNAKREEDEGGMIRMQTTNEWLQYGNVLFVYRGMTTFII